MTRAALLVLQLGLLGLAARAGAECWDSTEEGRVLGVAPDGSFLYQLHSEIEAGGGDNLRLELHGPDGALRASFARCEGEECDEPGGGWKASGEPALVALATEGLPPPALIEALGKATGATQGLMPSRLPVRVVDEDETHAFRSGATLLHREPLLDLAQGDFPTRRWRARLYEHPRSPLLFLATSEVSHTHAIADCTEKVSVFHWMPRRRLTPGDLGAEADFCASGSRQRESCLGRLGRLAARGEPGRLLAEPEALEGLTTMLAAMREGTGRGPAADGPRRAAVMGDVLRVCGRALAAPEAEARAAATDCLTEAARPVPPPEPPAPLDSCDRCHGAVAGVAEDGAFIYARGVRGEDDEVVEVHAPDGALRLRFRRCSEDDDGPCWLAEGAHDEALEEAAAGGPPAAELVARLRARLGATPLVPSPTVVAARGDMVMAGKAVLYEAGDLGRARPRLYEHPRARLGFLAVGRDVVWFPRARLLDPEDRSAHVTYCLERSERVDARADCLARLVDERMFGELAALAAAAADDAPAWSGLVHSAARLAAATGPARLLALASAGDPLVRAFAMGALAHFLDLGSPAAVVMAAAARACAPGLDGADARLLGEALRCLGETELAPPRARVLELLLRRPELELRTRALVSMINRDDLAPADLRAIAGILLEPLPPSAGYGDTSFRGETCHALAFRLGPADAWARPYLAAALSYLDGRDPPSHDRCADALARLGP